MKILIWSVLSLIAVLKLTAGAEQIVYAQLGETITLKPPPETSQQLYLYWRSGLLELAWRNTHGGSGVAKEGEDGKCKPESNKDRCEELKKWFDKLSLRGDSLVIKNIQQEHFGTVSCELTRGLGAAVHTVTYKILKLDVTVTPPTPLLPGEDLSLTCNAESPHSQKKPQIHWLDPQGQKQNSQGRLTVKATSQHSGRWTCVVTYDGKQAHVSVTVIDLSPAPSHPQYTSKSTPLKVPCSLPEHISWEQIKAKGIRGGNWYFAPKPGSSPVSGQPQTLFSLSEVDPPTWTTDQHRELVLNNKKPEDLTLTRKQGREDDSGDYVCTLSFKNGATLNRTVRVEVLQIFTPKTELISGEQLNLTCGVGHTLPPDLRLKWIPPKTSSLSSALNSDRDPAHLAIPAVVAGDGGRWKCELWRGQAALTSAVITLKIEPRLSVWMLVIICSVTVIVLLLLLLVFIFCRRRQRKTTRLRHRLCHCKHPKPKGFYRT